MPTSSAASKATQAAVASAQALTSANKFNTAVAPQSSNKTILRDLIKNDDIRKQFANALGKHSDTFLASIIDLYNSDSQLKQCAPAQVVAEALKAATLRMPINKQLGFSYIIPFNNSKQMSDGSWQKVMEPTFQIGYKGYIQLAMRTGQYRCINADVVFEGEFKTKDKLTGEIDLSGTKTSDKVVGYFAHEQLNNGFTKTLYMTVEEVAAHAKRYSKGVGFKTTTEDLIAAAAKPFDPNSKSVGWIGNFHSMAQKTLIRLLLSKYGYLSIEMNNAMAHDIDSDSSLDAENNPNYEGITEDTPYQEVTESAPAEEVPLTDIQ